MTLLAFALAYLGMTLLCLAMPRHHRQCFTRAPSPTRQFMLRLAAAALLLSAAGACLAALGLAIGLVVWLGQTMAAGVLVGLVLAWRERWLMPLGGLLGLAGVLIGLS